MCKNTNTSNRGPDVLNESGRSKDLHEVANAANAHAISLEADVTVARQRIASLVSEVGLLKAERDKELRTANSAEQARHAIHQLLQIFMMLQRDLNPASSLGQCRSWSCSFHPGVLS